MRMPLPLRFTLATLLLVPLSLILLAGPSQPGDEARLQAISSGR